MPTTSYQTISYTVPSNTTHIRFYGYTGSQWMYIDNVTFSGGTQRVVSKTTDANGAYLFTGADCVEPNTTYAMRIAADQTPLDGLFVTPQDASADFEDSDSAELH